MALDKAYLDSSEEYKEKLRFISVLGQLKRILDTQDYLNLCSDILDQVTKTSFCLDLYNEAENVDPKMAYKYRMRGRAISRILDLSAKNSSEISEDKEVLKLPGMLSHLYGSAVIQESFLEEVATLITDLDWYRTEISAHEISRTLAQVTQKTSIRLGLIGKFSKNEQTPLSEVDVVFWGRGKDSYDNYMAEVGKLRLQLVERLGRPINMLDKRLFTRNFFPKETLNAMVVMPSSSSFS